MSLSITRLARPRCKRPFVRQLNTQSTEPNGKGRKWGRGENVFISRSPKDADTGAESNGLGRQASLNANTTDDCVGYSYRRAWPIRDVLPTAIKDNIASRDGLTTCASGILQTHHSPFDAHVLERLHKAGVRIVGKTNLDEFGMGSNSTNSYFGTVKNAPPSDVYSAGGSSGGSAVAVVTGQCRAALGTDTGGSVRLPAAYTGIVGFKPSYGMISRWGVVPYANSMDTVGILARKVTTISEVFDLVRGHDSRDPTSAKDSLCSPRLIHRKSLAGIRIGVPQEYKITEVERLVRQSWKNALSLLEENGCEIVPISLPTTRHALSAYYVLAPAEAASNLSKYDGVRYGTRSDSSDGEGDTLYSKTRGQGFGDEVKRRILLGSYTLSSEAISNYFIQAQKIRRLVQQDFDRVFALPHPLHPPEQFDLAYMEDSVILKDKRGPPQVDFIVCPTAPVRPPRLSSISDQTPLDSYMNDVFTVPASLAGLPAISIPSKPMKSNPTLHRLGKGIQIIGQYSDDDRVLWIATRLQQLQAKTTAKQSNYVPQWPPEQGENHAEHKNVPISYHNSTASPLDIHPTNLTKDVLQAKEQALSRDERLFLRAKRISKVVKKCPTLRIRFSVPKILRAIPVQAQPDPPLRKVPVRAVSEERVRVRKYVSQKWKQREERKRLFRIRTFVSEKGDNRTPASLTSVEMTSMLEKSLDIWSSNASNEGNMELSGGSSNEEVSSSSMLGEAFVSWRHRAGEKGKPQLSESEQGNEVKA